MCRSHDVNVSRSRSRDDGGVASSGARTWSPSASSRRRSRWTMIASRWSATKTGSSESRCSFVSRAAISARRQAAGQELGGHRGADGGVRPAQQTGERRPLRRARPAGHDRPDQRGTADRQATGRRAGTAPRRARRVVGLDEHHRHLVRHRPVGATGGRAHRRRVRGLGEHEVDELLAVTLAQRAGLLLLEHVAVRRGRGELVDEEEHRLGERRQRVRGELHLERRRRDVTPEDPDPDLIDREQIGQIPALAPLRPAEVLEELPLTRTIDRAVVGDRDDPAQDRTDPRRHLLLVGSEELRVVRHPGRECLTHVHHQIGDTAPDGGGQGIERRRGDLGQTPPLPSDGPRT